MAFAKAPSTHKVNKDADKTLLQLTNPSTGEITEWDISTDEGLARSYEAATKLETSLKKAKDTMKQTIRERMGDDEEREAGKNFKFVKGERNSYGYDASKLRDIIDQDTLNEVSDINTKRLEKLLDEYKIMGILTADQLDEVKAAKVVMGSSEVLKVQRLLEDDK